MNTGYNRGTKERFWWRMTPVLVFRREVHAGQVTSNASHRNRAAAPWLAKVEVEGIIFYILAACVVLCRISP